MTTDVPENMKDNFCFHVEYHKLKLGEIDYFRKSMLQLANQIQLERKGVGEDILDRAHSQVQ